MPAGLRCSGGRPRAPPLRKFRLLQELQNGVRQLVGLGQNRHTGLLKDLLLGEVGHFGSHVHVDDATDSRGEVLAVDFQVGLGVLDAVLNRTEFARCVGDFVDRFVDRFDFFEFRAFGRFRQFERFDGDDFFFVGADLEGDRRLLCEKFDAVELRRFTDACDLFFELVGLGFDRFLVRCRRWCRWRTARRARGCAGASRPRR